MAENFPGTPEALQISTLYQGWLREYAPDMSYVDRFSMGPTAPRPMAHVHQAQEVFSAPSSNHEGETIPYVRVGCADTDERPILYVPGFTAGIEAKLPFALGMAKRRGVEVIMPGQNRKEILKDALTGKKDATHSQAANMMDVLAHAGLAKEAGSVDIVTHSYGSLIFEAMTKIAATHKLRCFKGANVAMMAPAGMNRFENPFSLGWRFLKGFRAEGPMKKDIFDLNYYEALGAEMFEVGKKNALANVPRTVREAWELARRRLNIAELRGSGIGSLAILPFAEDDVFPAHLQRRMIARAFAADAVPDGADLAQLIWATPISLQGKDGQPIRGRLDAGHNDDQHNPARAAGAVFQVLRPEKTLRRIGFKSPEPRT